jgi:16S rRNA C1402 (ribose-2'-O) methylase RsmI
LPTDAFAFFGALPVDLSRFAAEPNTMIFTTANLIPALERITAAFGTRAVAVAALIQSAEIVYRASAEAALSYFRDHPIMGEVILVVAGTPPVAAIVWDQETVLQALRQRLAAGEPLKLAAKAVANEAGWDRRTVYALGVEEKGNTP